MCDICTIKMLDLISRCVRSLYTNKRSRPSLPLGSPPYFSTLVVRTHYFQKSCTKSSHLDCHVAIDMLRSILPLIHSVLFFMPSQGYLVSPPVTRDNVLHCGSNPEEAKRLGCHFDMFSFAYYALPCYNKQLHDDFLAQHRDEIQWTQMDYTPVTTEEVLEGIHTDLRPISGQFHDLHCTYEWLRLISALAEERPLDRKLSKFEHSHHCSMNLLEKDKSHRNETATQTASLLFGRCGLTAELMYAYGTKD